MKRGDGGELKNCPNCGQLVRQRSEHLQGWHPGMKVAFYSCKGEQGRTFTSMEEK